jgi:hypothetical protein
MVQLCENHFCLHDFFLRRFQDEGEAVHAKGRASPIFASPVVKQAPLMGFFANGEKAYFNEWLSRRAYDARCRNIPFDGKISTKDRLMGSAEAQSAVRSEADFVSAIKRMRTMYCAPPMASARICAS